MDEGTRDIQAEEERSQGGRESWVPVSKPPSRGIELGLIFRCRRAVGRCDRETNDHLIPGEFNTI